MLGQDRLDELGGVQTVITNLARGFAEIGVPTEFLGIEPAGDGLASPAGGPHDRVSTVLSPVRSDLPYEPVDRMRRLRLLARGYRAGLRIHDRGVERLRRWHRTDPAPVMLATQLRLAEYAIAAGLGRRTIGQYHSSFAAAADGPDLARILAVSPRLAGFCVLTDADAAAFAAAGVPRARAVTNPVTVPRSISEPAARSRTVLTAGRFVADKNLPMLVRAWEALGDDRGDWRLRIVGAGPLESALRSQIVRAGLDDSVTIEPPVADLSGLLAEASIFTLSSVREGLPMVLAEAMAAGLPFAGTDCAPGVRELADDGRAGLLTPVGDPVAFAATLRRLMADRPLRDRLGRHGRQFIRRRTPVTVATQWLTVFDDYGLLDRRTTGIAACPTGRG